MRKTYILLRTAFLKKTMGTRNVDLAGKVMILDLAKCAGNSMVKAQMAPFCSVDRLRSNQPAATGENNKEDIFE